MKVYGVTGSVCDIREVVIKSGDHAGETRQYGKFLCDGKLLPVELAPGVVLEAEVQDHDLDIVWGDTYKDGKYIKYYRAILLS